MSVLCIHQVSWLPCQFIDEEVFIVNERGINVTETKLIHREAVLQFGQKGDAPLNPHAITYLVTGSKLDLRRYVEDVEAEQLKCEIRRYSTEGNHVRWPVKGDQEYNRWFTCTLRHIKDLFTVTSFLRQPSNQPPSGRHDYHSWPAIEDREIFNTTVAMITKTLTPSVTAALGSTPRLHCQFAVDHKSPQVTVEWHRYHRGRRIRLFSHISHTGQMEGSGVELMNLINGDASFTVPHTEISSEGKYFCSVSVNPMSISMDIYLHIEESPRVSLNVGPTLYLQEGEEKKVICHAENYYPLDVEVVWHSEDLSASAQRVGGSRSKVLHNHVHSNHKNNLDNTYSLSASIYLTALSRDSGRQFTCNVSHQSLREPISQSFILVVTGPNFWVVFIVVDIFLLVVMYKLLPRLCSRKRKSAESLPY
ncbi:tapasin-related protein-like isoform X2 [Notolabrus celidotus]|uniref:tapasin-related protein-like isoform X2 n=1 Tax=Notolabrus celidotus TaxID=1203425 RepID=UPI001490242C|nr:tapasin-related protein-like isoform X2 [Notolabrus celidotus]